ncbi:MAG TPA: hypothetical protein VKH37_03735, partial [Ferruginibacter sp.]|nr:hypothetical protein [Ferruginibacter sp.]
MSDPIEIATQVKARRDKNSLGASGSGDLEKHFSVFRRNIIGDHQCFGSPFGKKEIVYADWTATGRAYRPIEECLQRSVMPFLANTHT